MTRLLPWMFILAGGLIVTWGDILLKRWVDTNNNSFYLWGILIYLVGTNFLAQSFKFKNIAVASLLYILINVIALILFNYFYFKEPLSKLQLVGILLGLVSMGILELAESH